MTISDKIRIYELSRDLNLDNKDILDAAQKLSISVKSHSSSISVEEAKKIKNLINKKNSDKKILSIKKPSIQNDNYKQNKEDESSFVPKTQGKPPKDNSNKKPLLIKPLNKPESLKIISNQSKNLNKPTITKSSQSPANLTNQNTNNKTSQNLNQDKKNFQK
jgi:translation initiation factor IF-2